MYKGRIWCGIDTQNEPEGKTLAPVPGKGFSSVPELATQPVEVL